MLEAEQPAIGTRNWYVVIAFEELCFSQQHDVLLTSYSSMSIHMCVRRVKGELSHIRELGS